MVSKFVKLLIWWAHHKSGKKPWTIIRFWVFHGYFMDRLLIKKIFVEAAMVLMLFFFFILLVVGKGPLSQKTYFRTSYWFACISVIILLISELLQCMTRWKAQKTELQGGGCFSGCHLSFDDLHGITVNLLTLCYVIVIPLNLERWISMFFGSWSMLLGKNIFLITYTRGWAKIKYTRPNF